MWNEINLPHIPAFTEGDNILIAGAGGGFDVFSGLPLFFELKQRGKNVHLANYSFSDFDICQSEHQETLNNGACRNVMGKVVRCGLRGSYNYYPEGYLAEWLWEAKNGSVWMLQKLGVKPTRKSYEQLIERLNIDTLVLVDGGVDSLFHGDEQDHGTIIEDTISLAATHDLPVKHKILAAIGFGTEVEDHVCHYQVLKNIAKLIEKQAFYGTCSVYNPQYGFQMMDEAYTYTVGQEAHGQSHITPRITAAGFGTFGLLNGKADYLINPFMNMYWFLNLLEVAKENVLIDSRFKNTVTALDATVVFRQKHQHLTRTPGPKLTFT